MKGPYPKSEFAVLDVKQGRRALAEKCQNRGRSCRIPVVITGYITGIHSNDDGISREFSVEVISLRLDEA